VDFEGSQHDAHVAEVLSRLQPLTISLKNLGSYPADTAETESDGEGGDT
jgi:prephenate dehydratase